VSKEPTLADAVIRETLRPRSALAPAAGHRSLAGIRASILDARKFVLDDRMAAFLADLQRMPFAGEVIRRPSVLDTMRHGSMLPHPKTWVEFPARAFRKRAIELEAKDPWGSGLAGADEIANTWGWLFEEHPQLPSVITMTEFMSSEEGYPILMLPFTVVWNTQDLPLPWNDVDIIAGQVAHGILTYDCKQIGVRMNRPLSDFDNESLVDIVIEENGQVLTTMHHLVGETAGLCRYALAFLSTLNDVPTITTEVRPSKGYIARGTYKKFVEHKVITLNVPEKKNMQMLARRVFAQSRRRMHEVRGHWRLTVPPTGGFICDQVTAHQWGAIDEDNHAHCANCVVRRTWIKKHYRGDASLGVVTHDYKITHKEPLP
jgi:hypothetical protein